MREKWINIGMEDEELKPYIECPSDVLDPVRIGNSCHVFISLSCTKYSQAVKLRLSIAVLILELHIIEYFGMKFSVISMFSTKPVAGPL